MPPLKFKLNNDIALEPPDRVDDQTDSNGDGDIYLGWCNLGNSISDTSIAWRICKITLSNSGKTMVKLWAGGLLDYAFTWTGKESLPFSNLKRI